MIWYSPTSSPVGSQSPGHCREDESLTPGAACDGGPEGVSAISRTMRREFGSRLLSSGFAAFRSIR
jgi:hypothetical protein